MLLDILCEHRPVQLVRAKCAPHEEGTTPPEKGTNTCHLHEVLPCCNNRQTEVEVEEHIGDEEEVEVAAMGGQQDYRPLANSLFDLALRRWK